MSTPRRPFWALLVVGVALVATAHAYDRRACTQSVPPSRCVGGTVSNLCCECPAQQHPIALGSAQGSYRCVPDPPPVDAGTPTVLPRIVPPSHRPHPPSEPLPPCPAGQVRNADTRDHCCWPGQSWNTARGSCVGIPIACPPALPVVRGEECVAGDRPARQCPEGMVYEGGGTFTMGSPPGVGEPDEHPAHNVTLSPFCIDRTEVTVAAFAARRGSIPEPGAYMATPGQDHVFCNWGRSDRSQHPVNCVDWDQADAWCRATGGMLPTEAQWEFAARGLQGREYPWGPESPSAERANLCGAECTEYAATVGFPNRTAISGWHDRSSTTAPVGSFPTERTPEGVDDLAGNVWEWVRDPYEVDAYQHPGPEGFNSREVLGNYNRVQRGGGWDGNAPSAARGANRRRGIQGGRDIGVGFRCVRGVP